MPRNRSVVNRAAEIEAAAPPVPALEALRRNLLYAMLKGVSEEDMTAVVAKQVEKAREGDPKAARLLIDMLRGGEPQAARVQQTTVYGHHGNVTIFLSDIRHKLACVLVEEGPRPTEFLAERTRVLLPDALRALDHPWFEKEADGWHVTATGRREAVEMKG